MIESIEEAIDCLKTALAKTDEMYNSSCTEVLVEEEWDCLTDGTPCEPYTMKVPQIKDDGYQELKELAALIEGQIIALSGLAKKYEKFREPDGPDYDSEW